MKAIVLHSGGLDSTTLISRALEDGAEEVLALTIRYGSLHNDAEGIAAESIVDYLQDRGVNISREVYELPAEIFQGDGSALMGEQAMPALTYQEIQQSEGPSPTVVPFRNANLLSIAAAIAEARGYDIVYIGAHADDAHQWAYPDCTPEFLGAMANAIFVGTYQKVRLSFPFIWMQKYEIVRLAAGLESPLDMTWSCYNPQWNGPQIIEEDISDGEFVHCGKCPTCIERANAFAEAGFIDPTSYMVPLHEILGPLFDLEDLEEWPL